MSIEVGYAERPLENKGHDRLVLLEDLGRFAVFDGAGQAIASSLAAKIFREQHQEGTLPSLSEVLEQIQLGLMDYQDSLSEAYKMYKYPRGLILTTGTAIGIRPDSNNFEYAHAGDSALYMFDFASGNLAGITRQEVIGPWADIKNFLGFPKHRLLQHGEIALPDHAAFTLFSDGVGNKANPEDAISEELIAEILGSELSCEEKARNIIEASSINDDRAVIVIEHNL